METVRNDASGGSTSGSDLSIEYVEIRNITRDQTLRIEDPLETFLSRTESPFFVVGDSVELEVSLTNSDGTDERVVAQYRPWFILRKRIVHLNDQAISPDAVAGDDICTGSWNPYLQSGLRHVNIDVFDEDLLTEEDVSYNAIFWRVPYYVFPFFPE